MATITAVASGDWHTPGTWSTGSVPTVADDVYLGGYTLNQHATNYNDIAGLTLTSGVISLGVGAYMFNGQAFVGVAGMDGVVDVATAADLRVRAKHYGGADITNMNVDFSIVALRVQ